MNRTVIVDLDGTISDTSQRMHLYKEKDYKAFNEAGINDKPIENVCNLVRSVKDCETKIVIMTARDESCRPSVKEWLKLNDVPYDDIIMRPSSDQSPDHVCKQRLFEKNFEYSDIWFALEDRKSVVDMWRGEGVTCLQVAPGDF